MCIRDSTIGAPEWYNNPYAPISEELKHYGYPNTAYFLTHGRKGTCADTAENLKVILELRGYESIVVPGSMSPSLGHPWVETNIDGEIYVADYNKLIPRDEFYEKNKWDKGKDYDPDWYEKGLKTFQKEHFLLVVA